MTQVSLRLSMPVDHCVIIILPSFFFIPTIGNLHFYSIVTLLSLHLTQKHSLCKYFSVSHLAMTIKVVIFGDRVTQNTNAKADTDTTQQYFVVTCSHYMFVFIRIIHVHFLKDCHQDLNLYEIRNYQKEDLIDFQDE